MSGTVLITGANSTLAIPSVENLLSKYPTYTAILTVRNTSESDQNTSRLRNIVSQFPKSKVLILPLDLSSLSEVEEFAKNLSLQITKEELEPLTAIICNAYAWSITGGLKFSTDGYEVSMSVNHLAHLSMVVRLLGNLKPEGRIIFLGSDSHYPGKNSMETYPPSIPPNMELLVHPEADEKGEEVGRGFQRYSNSKLAIIMGMYALNRRLLLDSNFRGITAVAIDPGNMPDSRCMHQGVPALWKYGMVLVAPLRPVWKYMNPTLRPANEAAVDLIEIAVGEKYAGTRGFYAMLKPEESSPESMDEVKQESLWLKSLEWAKVEKKDTLLKSAFDSVI